MAHISTRQIPLKFALLFMCVERATRNAHITTSKPNKNLLVVMKVFSLVAGFLLLFGKSNFQCACVFPTCFKCEWLCGV